MLYLKKIEMYGFKSFADKIELKFDQPITGIVGPNGCGKSNVSDAIRWVLGEQSTKTLRGKKMSDLIFSGTDTRKAMSYCEVSLFLDNTTRIFPIEMDEIIISRKLYRNNDCDYLLNRNIVRLKDIQDMLRSVGLGKEGYSIVGQGRMDAILNARPEDRRAIFEEALGISSFRVKKVETERKLEKTRLNMESLQILTSELERQLTPLRRQSTIAKKYLDLRDRLRYHEINAYIYSYDHASQDKEDGKKKVAGLTEEFNYKTVKYTKLNERYDELFHQIATLEDDLNVLRNKQVEYAVELQKQVGDKNLVQERINNIRGAIELAEKDIADYCNALEDLQRALAETRQLLAKRNTELANLQEEGLTVIDNYNVACRQVDSLQKQIEQIQESLTENLRLVSQFSGLQASALTETDALLARLDSIKAQQQEISARISNISSKEGDLITVYEQSKQEKEKLQAQCADLTASVKQQEYSLLENFKIVQRNQQHVASEQGSIDLLVDFAKNYRGYQSSVQSLMRDAKDDKQLKSHLCDVVANIVNVDKKYQLAMDVALGNRVQNVITNTVEDVKYLIKYLNDNDYGRVTFLPIASMKPRGIEKPEVLNEKCVLGIAKDLISFDSKYQPIFNAILGGIIIVDTYDNAVAVSKKYGYAHRIVTLTGERIFNDGSFEGGSVKSKGASLLSYENQLAERTAKLESLKQTLAEADSTYQQLKSKLDNDKQQLQQLTDRLYDVTVQLATAKEKIETSNTLSNSDKQLILSLTAESEKINARLNEISKNGNESVIKLSELKQQEQKLVTTLEEMKAKLTTALTEKDQAYEVVSNNRYRLSLLKTNVVQSENDIETLKSDILKTEDALDVKQRYVGQLKESLQILIEGLDNTGEYEQLSAQLEDIKSQLAVATQTKAELNSEFQKASDERMQLSTELESLRSAIDMEEYKIQKIDDDLQELQQRVLDEYNVTYSAAMAYKDEEYQISESKAQIAELRQSMQNLGYVNVNAIEELKSVEERYASIKEQMEDLTKAETDLKEILKQLTVEIEGRFATGIVEINENFKTVFRELFNGGNAKLTLDNDPEKDPLDCGVEIEAQPPGKRLQNISLLSGGERTLTAAAILFAILKLHPMPFCVLDEIEAALDDANADRIAKYLRKFSDDTQFIVITHKKPTMENADVLYGVTMEEKGVSKMVSVKLNDAIKQAQ